MMHRPSSALGRGRASRVWITFLFLAAAPSMVAAGGALVGDRATRPMDGDEMSLLSVLDDVHRNRLDSALRRAERLVQRNPKFRLAQLVYGDLLLAESGRIQALGRAAKGIERALTALREEARARLAYQLSRPPAGRLPAQLLQLSERQRRVLVVDLSRSRLYLIERRGDALVVASDFYVSSGKRGALKAREGDQKTPVGVYFVTTRLDPETLSDFYGAGAFPINYPNEWDQRLGRTGYGIWVHGVPSETYSRAPRASDGCMAIPNSDLEVLWDRVDVGETPVVIADAVDWVDPDSMAARRGEFIRSFEQWQRDWESLDIERYAGHYSKEFRAEGRTYTTWLRQKRQVNAAKEWLQVRPTDVSVFGYPGEDGLVVVTFEQQYRSSNSSRQARKRQYWRREGDGVWRIVYEGTARFLPIHLRGIPFSARSRLARAATAGAATRRE